MIKQNVRLLINNKDFTNKLLANSLSINISLDDYKFDFELDLFDYELEQVEAGMEVILKENDRVICGGILLSIDYDLVSSINGVYRYCVSINVDNYTNLINRIIVDKIDVWDENLDLNKAENIFFKYFEKYLKPYGFTIKKIQTSLTIDEMEEMEEDKVSLKELFDNLAELTRSEYMINYKKEFFVYRGIADFKTHDRIIENHEIGKVSIKKDLLDYKNKIILVGGDASYDTEDDFVTEEGKIQIEVENKEEILRMKNLLGGDGIFSKKEENSNITNVEELKEYATFLLNKYSKIPINIEFSTTHLNELILNNQYIEVGDFIKLRLNGFTKFDNEEKDFFYCCVDEINIKDISSKDYLEYTYTVSRRKDNLKKDSWLDYLNPGNGNKNDEVKPNEGVIVDTIDIQIQNTIITEANIYLVDL